MKSLTLLATLEHHSSTEAKSGKLLSESAIDRNWVPRPESECPVLQRAHGLPCETCVHRIKIKHLNVDLRKQFCFILAGRGSFLIKILF